MSFENILLIICFCAPIILGLSFWAYTWFQDRNAEKDIQKWIQEEKWFQEERRKFKYEEASQTYKELKAVMGEEIDKILEGQDSDSIVEILNYVGRTMSLAGCSMDQATDALRGLALSLEDYTETPKQKEPQVIFEPKTMIIEPEGQKPIKIAGENIISIKQDDEINPLDDWYERFMEEVKLG